MLFHISQTKGRQNEEVKRRVGHGRSIKNVAVHSIKCFRTDVLNFFLVLGTLYVLKSY